MTEEKKTIPEWEEEYGVDILDPDGFDRSDPNLYEKKFTKEEFEEGLMYCTIQCQPPEEETLTREALEEWFENILEEG